MANLNITYQSPKTLKPRATNPRTHSKKQIRQIADSIEAFGPKGQLRCRAGHPRPEGCQSPGCLKRRLKQAAR